MDKIILAMLFLRSRTLYELKVKFSGDLGLLYSGSTGSIQAALKKLLAAGLICCSETVENGRLKKIYEITDTGREEFHKWINSPFDGGNRSPINTLLTDVCGMFTAILRTVIFALRFPHIWEV